MVNAIPRPEHPRPDFMRSDWLNLNGVWQFAFDDGNAGLKEKWYLPGRQLDRDILVPFCYESKESGIGDTTMHPVMWYRRTFNRPAWQGDSRVLLRFGAVDYRCDVYLNGQHVGSHTGGYIPFALDITDALTDGENDLCLRIEDGYDCAQPRGKQRWKRENFGCWYTPCSGIWQTVCLEKTGRNYIESAHIRPDIDAGTAQLTICLKDMPEAPVEARVNVSIRNELFRSQTVLLCQKRQRVVIDMVSGSDMHMVEMWFPENPALYDVDISLSTGDHVKTYFGMRKIEVRDGMVLLNNQPLYQRLILDQGYWPDTLLTPPSDEAIRSDIQWTQRFGYNGARKHQKIADPRYYYWADKMGLLVWEEVPSAYEFSWGDGGKYGADTGRSHRPRL